MWETQAISQHRTRSSANEVRHRLILIHPRHREAINVEHGRSMIHDIAIKIKCVTDLLGVVIVFLKILLLQVPSILLNRVARLHVRVSGLFLLLHSSFDDFIPLFEE